MMPFRRRYGSMGGLVIADATLKLIRERDSQINLKESIIWPGIIGLIGYDTPYYGLNPPFFVNTVNEYVGYAKTAQQIINNLGIGVGIPNQPGSSKRANQNNDGTSSSSEPKKSNPPSTTPPTDGGHSWMKLGLAAVGVAGLAIAAGTTYNQKNNIVQNLDWATSHLDFIKEIFETDRLNQRMSNLMKIKPVVNFHCFYTEITNVHVDSNRHFIKLPTPDTIPKGIHTSFSVNQNQKAQNEIKAHTTMFNQNLNSGYWDLGRESARLISEWFEESQKHRIHQNQNQNFKTRNKSFKSDHDAETRDRLSKDAPIEADVEIGNQHLRDEL